MTQSDLPRCDNLDGSTEPLDLASLWPHDAGPWADLLALCTPAIITGVEIDGVVRPAKDG
jgi:hypothetical protein